MFATIVEENPKKWPTYPEMQYFTDELNRRGIHAELIDLCRETLEFSHDKLRLKSNGREIDLVYKRILWQDVKKTGPDTAEALAMAYLSGAACFVNGLGARLAGHKMILAMIKAPLFSQWVSNHGKIITDQERSIITDYIPDTFVWGDTFDPIQWPQEERYQEVYDDPAKFVLKSFHGYGGKEVMIGRDEEHAGDRFAKAWNGKYICQQFIPHGREIIPVLQGDKISHEYQYFNLGAYVINGKCAAVEAKVSQALPIGMNRPAFALPAYRTAVFPTR